MSEIPKKIEGTSNLKHLVWLKKTKEKLFSSCGKQITVWNMECDMSDEKTWSAWAKHFREHYCADTLIDTLKKGTPYEDSRRDFLLNMKFPQLSTTLGPSLRAGDFGEILIMDIIEHTLDMWVPRVRFKAKAVPDESEKGTDVIGCQFKNSNHSPSNEDRLLAFETKTQLSGNKPKSKLQEAITHSSKDILRKALTLTAIKQRLIEENRKLDAAKIERFQDKLKRPYIEQSGAAALFCNSIYDASHITSTTSCKDHNNPEELQLIVVHGPTFMKVVNLLYERAANEA